MRFGQSLTSGSSLRELFVARDNAWMTFADIEKAGIKKPSARTSLYTANRDEFERESKQGGQRQTKFRLRHPDKSE